MSEPFEAIGFGVTDRDSYRALAEEAHHRGDLTRITRSDGVLHGCCWNLGAGLEVWTMLYESSEGTYYADCRPAFRARQVYQLYPWEILEYEVDGHAMLTGLPRSTDREMSLVLQNITEINLKKLPRGHITVAVSGLAYKGKILSRTRREPHFEQEWPATDSAENDYRILGRIVSVQRMRNLHTTDDLRSIRVDLGDMQLEVIINQKNLIGDPQPGRWLQATIWLQGHMLTERHIEARYEGIDSRIPRQHYWRSLHRGPRPGLSQ